jgi:adenylylsulfate kinase-like enzyme
MTTTARAQGATVWLTGLPSADTTGVDDPYEPPTDAALVLAERGLV